MKLSPTIYSTSVNPDFSVPAKRKRRELEYKRKIRSIENSNNQPTSSLNKKETALRQKKDRPCDQVKLELANKVLKKTRLLFKSAKLKSSNKTYIDSGIKKIQESIEKINEIRRTNVPLETKLIDHIEAGSGNCGEMALIAFAMCHKYTLECNYITYRSIDFSFEHAVCVVKISSGENFIIDPWSNILCSEKDYITRLSQKIKYWEDKGKIILKSNFHIPPGIDILSQYNEIEKIKVSHLDVLNLHIDFMESLFFKNLNFDSSKFLRNLTGSGLM